MMKLKIQDLKQVVICSKDNHILVDPYRLQCCHSYCKACLPTTDSGYQCTECQAVTPKHMVKKSFFVQQLIQKYQWSLEQPKCHRCEGRQPEFKCYECQILLCPDCEPLHKRAEGFRYHQLSAYHAGDDDMVVVSGALFCDAHRGKVLKFFCRQCDEMICSRCNLLDHEHHCAVSLEDALNDVGRLYEELQKKTEDLAGQYRQFIGSVQEAEACFNDHINTSLEELTTYRDEIITSINRQYEECQQKIKQKQDEVTEKLTEQKNTELVKSARLENIRNWFELVQKITEQHCKMKIYLDELRDLKESLTSDEVQPIMYPASVRDIKLDNLKSAYDNSSKWLVGDISTKKSFSRMSKSGSFLKQDVKDIGNVLTAFKDKPAQNDNWLPYLWDTSLVDKLKTEWEYDFPKQKIPRSLFIRNDNIILPLWESNDINVISKAGKLLKTITLPAHLKCYSFQRISETELVLSTKDGLYICPSAILDTSLIATDTLKVNEKLYEGKFGMGLYVNNGEFIALKVGSNDVVEFLCSLGSRIVQSNIITLDGEKEFDFRDTVVKYQDRLYVGYWGSGKVCAYSSVMGSVLAQYDIKDPILLSVDTQGALTCCQGWGTKRLSVLDPSASGNIEVVSTIECDGHIVAAGVSDKNLYIVHWKGKYRESTQRSSLSRLSMV